jgi:hypothetical protein
VDLMFEARLGNRLPRLYPGQHPQLEAAVKLTPFRGSHKVISSQGVPLQLNVSSSGGSTNLFKGHGLVPPIGHPKSHRLEIPVMSAIHSYPTRRKA